MNTTDIEPNDKQKPARAKWETELEEILAASDREPTPVEKARGKVVAARYQAPVQVRHTTNLMTSRMTRGAWLVVFLALVIGAYAIRHFSPFLGRTLAIAAVALLVVIVIRGMMKPSSVGGPSQMWRGRKIGPENPSEQSWRSRLFDRDKTP